MRAGWAGAGAGGRGRKAAPPLLAPEPNTPHVGVEFSVLELWSLGKLLFFPLVSPPLPGDRDCTSWQHAVFPAACLGSKPWCAVRGGMVTMTLCPVCSAVSDIPQYSQLVLNVCETLQEEVIALFDQTRHSLASGSATEDKDSMETDDCSRPRHKDQRDGVRARPRKLSVLPPASSQQELPACLLCARP